MTPYDGAALAEQVVIKGDLSKLTEADRMAYYTEVCRSLGLNPLTRPFEYISLNGKLTLYATRAAGDQLRAVRGITITGLVPSQIGDLFVVVASGRDRTGRDDSSTGAVSIKGLGGEALANAMMKAETKAKRRLTLSLAGLGWSDETEVVDIPGATVEPPVSLAERVEQRAATVGSFSGVEPIDVLAQTAAPDVTETALEPTETPATSEPDAVPGLTLEAFATAIVGYKRDEVRAVAKSMYPDAKKFSDLNDVQRLALWEQVTSDLHMGTDLAPKTTCAHPSPFTGITCDLDPGHPGAHRSGSGSESW
jgi:hypothetical protein